MNTAKRQKAAADATFTSWVEDRTAAEEVMQVAGVRLNAASEAHDSARTAAEFDFKAWSNELSAKYGAALDIGRPGNATDQVSYLDRVKQLPTKSRDDEQRKSEACEKLSDRLEAAAATAAELIEAQTAHHAAKMALADIEAARPATNKAALAAADLAVNDAEAEAAKIAAAIAKAESQSAQVGASIEAASVDVADAAAAAELATDAERDTAQGALVAAQQRVANLTAERQAVDALLSGLQRRSEASVDRLKSAQAQQREVHFAAASEAHAVAEAALLEVVNGPLLAAAAALHEARKTLNTWTLEGIQHTPAYVDLKLPDFYAVETERSISLPARPRLEL